MFFIYCFLSFRPCVTPTAKSRYYYVLKSFQTLYYPSITHTSKVPPPYQQGHHTPLFGQHASPVIRQKKNRQLEARLSFSFLPGLSWPGQDVDAIMAAGGPGRIGSAGGAGTGRDDPNKRRNLAGLSPPLGHNAAEATAAAAAAVAAVGSNASSFASPDAAKVVMGGTSVVVGGGGGGGGGVGVGGRLAMEDGNYSSTDDEAGAGAIGLGVAPPRGG